MKIFHEVSSRICLTRAKFHQVFFSSWACIHKIITWDPSSFRRSCVNQSCRFHGDLQLSCWKFPLNHFTSWWKFGSKLWKNKKFSILKKFSKLRNFNISRWNLDFLMNKFHILTCFDELWSLSLNFDQKVKVWLFVYSWLFDQLTENSLSI